MRYGVKQISGYSHGMERIIRKFDSKEEAAEFAREMRVAEQYKDRGPLDKYVVVELPTLDENYKKLKGKTMKLHKEKLKEMIRAALGEQAKKLESVGKSGKRNRLARAAKGLDESLERMPGIKRYTVILKNIDWDTDLKDDSEPMSAEELGLPESLSIRVDASSEDEALDAALDRASDDFGFLINGTQPEFRVEAEEPESMDITKIVREMVKEEIAKHKTKRSK